MLEDDIAKYSAKVSSTAYSMSVGELIAMYRDRELGLHPEFQRFYRWTPEQKSRLIESLLLGIPIPPIFIDEKSDSKWEVIDGLQRLSTILEVTGELRDAEGNLRPQFQLTRTKYLRNLEGRRWHDENPDISLPEAARIKIKRARFDINIVKNVSDEIAKYEIFQRLNSGGSNATDQEVRNCILVMTDRSFFEYVSDLAKQPDFVACVPLTDRAIEEAYDLELIVRYLVLALADLSILKVIDELGTFLTEQSLFIAMQPLTIRAQMAEAFQATFAFLAEHLGSNAFKRYNPGKNKYLGAFLISIFEVVASGLGRRFYEGHGAPEPTAFLERHKQLWTETELTTNVGSGIRASTRIPHTVSYGRAWLANEQDQDS
jgi:hypothetical protein